MERARLLAPAVSGRPGLASALTAPLLLALAVAALYGQSLSYPLVFDGAIWFDEPRQRILEGYGYTDRYLSKKLAYLLWSGSQGDVTALRVVAAALHAMTAMLGYVFFSRLHAALPGVSGGRDSDPGPQSLALAGALIFALHPVLVYAVAYVGQMEIILAALFAMLFLTLYLGGLVRQDPLRLWASVAVYWIALLCKEHAIMIAAVALAVTVLLRPPSWALVRALAPYFLAYGAIALHVISLSDVGAGQAYEPSADLALHRAADLGLGLTAENAHAVSVISQLGYFFRYWLFWIVPLPQWLSIDLQYPLAADRSTWSGIAALVAFCAYAVLASILLARRGRPGVVGLCLLFPWLMFFTEFVAARLQEAFVLYRSYLWLIGPCWALPVMLRRTGKAFPAIVAGIAVALGAVGFERVGIFRSAYLVWNDAVEKNLPHEAGALGPHRAYVNRGNALVDLGRPAEAIEDYRRALALNARLGQAHANLAAVYVQTGRLELALQAANEAIGLGSTLSPSSLAAAYNNRGGIRLIRGDVSAAIDDFSRAVELDPLRVHYGRNLQRALDLRRGRENQ